MALVVLVHVTNKNFLNLDSPDHIEALWDGAGRVMTPLRMPLFFTVSGLLVVSSLQRSWGAAVLKRVVRPYYLYFLWIGLSLALYALIGSTVEGTPVSSFGEVMAKVLLPTTALWYFYALPLYYMVAKLCVNLPKHPVLAGAFIISVAGSFMPPSLHASIVMNLVFFMAGAYLPGAVRSIVERSTPGLSWIATVTYLSTAVLLVLGMDGVPGAVAVCSFVAVWAGLTTVATLSRWRWFARPMAHIGENTLAVYVIHMPLLALVDTFGPQSLPWPIGLIYPPLMAGMIVGSALFLHRALLRLSFKWLFVLPGRPASTHVQPPLDQRPINTPNASQCQYL